MIQLKNRFLRIAIFATIIATVVIIAGFSNIHSVFDGGTIINPNVVVPPNTMPPEIKATDASGCGGSVNYQWQQSNDGKNFIDIANATAASYQPVLILTATNFRRRAICVGSDTAYTNVATIIIQ